MLNRVLIFFHWVSFGIIIVSSILLARHGALISEEIKDELVLTAVLQGSGSKDDMVLGLGAILCLPLLVFRMIKIKQKPGIPENLATIGICALQFMLINFGLQISSISDTLRRSGNFMLIFWLTAYGYLLIQAFLRLLVELRPISAQS